MNANDPDALSTEVPVPAEPGADDAAPAPKPARRRRTTKKSEAAAPAADAAASPAEAAEAAVPAVAAPAEARAPEPVAERADAPVSADTPGAAVANESGEAPAQGESQAVAAEGEAPRKSRNRRRGKRDKDRGDKDRGDRAAAVERDAGEAGPGEAAPARPPRQPSQPPVAPSTGEVFAHVVSGEYDAEPAEAVEEEGPAKRVLAAEPDAPKLHKVLAQGGIGSRRDMEQMILEGRITVNGEPAHIGQRISYGDQVRVNGKPIKFRIAPPAPRVIAYHKPVGEVVTHDDPQQRPTVFRKLPRLQQGKWQSVGRLDINTEGLLLFTNSGELANQLMHPRFGVEREYAVRVLGTLGDEARAKLLEGVEIDGQKASFKSIEDGGGEGVNHWYRVVIAEGRNREVRKLFDAVGLTVSRLIRIRYGTVVLPRGLKRGVWIDLDENDVRTIRRLAGGGEPRQSREPEGDGGGKQGRGRRGSKRGGRGGQQGGPRRDEGGARRDEGGPIPNPLQTTFEKRPRGPRPEGGRRDENGPIPNPLQQTYDKRAMQQERNRRRGDNLDEDGPIPNPLQQTYDKRFVQKPRGPGLGGGGGGGGRGKKGGGAPKQPDPMQTSVGYIGADAFLRNKGGGRGGPRGGGGGGGRRGGR